MVGRIALEAICPTVHTKLETSGAIDRHNDLLKGPSELVPFHWHSFPFSKLVTIRWWRPVSIEIVYINGELNIMLEGAAVPAVDEEYRSFFFRVCPSETTAATFGYAFALSLQPGLLLFWERVSTDNCLYFAI